MAILLTPVCGALLQQRLQMRATGGQPDHLEAVGIGGDDLQGLSADGAGAAQHQHAQAAVGVRHQPIVPRPASIPSNPRHGQRPTSGERQSSAALAANTSIC